MPVLHRAHLLGLQRVLAYSVQFAFSSLLFLPLSLPASSRSPGCFCFSYLDLAIEFAFVGLAIEFAYFTPCFHPSAGFGAPARDQLTLQTVILSYLGRITSPRVTVLTLTWCSSSLCYPFTGSKKNLILYTLLSFILCPFNSIDAIVGRLLHLVSCVH
ncbi:hypothetical protein EV426DRAFT_81706 [Tirmania nivea]|nr:hypothetical protein EV426DRAFT_81706 [Tirmania nivea]